MKRFFSICLLAACLAADAHAGAASAKRLADPPLIASDALGQPREALILEGLASGGSRTTGLSIANLSDSSAGCTVSLSDADGVVLGEALTASLAPRGHLYLDDIFKGQPDLAGAQAAVVCDQAFYAFAVIPDRAAGGVAVVDPTPRPEKFTVGPCSAGSRVTCFDFQGLVHQPTTATPVKRVAFPVPPNTYGRVKMSLDVTVGAWYPADPDGKHLIYWFVLNKNFDMLGMLYLRGPAAHTALSRYGVGLTHPKKKKLVKPFKAVPGRTYRCENDLDMTTGVIKITVTDKASGEAVQLRGAANVSQLKTKAGDRFIIDMAFPEGKIPDEVPAYGWAFKDIHIEAYPK